MSHVQLVDSLSQISAAKVVTLPWHFGSSVKGATLSLERAHSMCWERARAGFMCAFVLHALLSAGSCSCSVLFVCSFVCSPVLVFAFWFVFLLVCLCSWFLFLCAGACLCLSVFGSLFVFVLWPVSALRSCSCLCLCSLLVCAQAWLCYRGWRCLTRQCVCQWLNTWLNSMHSTQLTAWRLGSSKSSCLGMRCIIPS